MTAPEVALQPVAQEDASGVGRATGVDTVNSRVNCFAISLAASPPPIHQGESVNPKLRTLQKAHLRRILLSSRARRKIGERCFLQITFPTKPDAKHIFDRDLVEVERNIQRFARSCPISRRSPRRRRAVLSPNYSISVPCKAQALLLKSFGSFLQKRTPLRRAAPVSFAVLVTFRRGFCRRLRESCRRRSGPREERLTRPPPLWFRRRCGTRGCRSSSPRYI